MSTVNQPQAGVLTPEIHSAYAIGVQVSEGSTATPALFPASTGDLVTNPVTVGAAAFSFARGFVVTLDGTVAFTDANGTAITGFPVVAGVVYPIGVSVMTNHSVTDADVYLLF